jgi:hypothetical protein
MHLIISSRMLDSAGATIGNDRTMRGFSIHHGRHRRPVWTLLRCLSRSTLGVLVLCLIDSTALADEHTLSPQLFRPSVDGLGLAVLEAPTMPEAGAYSVALFAGTANRPLSVRMDGSRENILDQMLSFDLVGAYAINDLIVAGAHVPVFQHTLPGAAESLTGVGDVALWGKGAVLTELGGPFSLSAGGRLKFPSGNSAEFMGDGAWTGEMTGLIGRHFGRFHAVGNLGYRLRSRPIDYANLDFRDEVLFGLGLAIAESSRRYTFEVHGSTPAAASFTGEQTPLEALAGLRQPVGKRFWIDAGVGRGLTYGYGSPAFRAFLGLRLVFPAAASEAGAAP